MDAVISSKYFPAFLVQITVSIAASVITIVLMVTIHSLVNNTYCCVSFPITASTMLISIHALQLNSLAKSLFLHLPV